MCLHSYGLSQTDITRRGQKKEETEEQKSTNSHQEEDKIREGRKDGMVRHHKMNVYNMCLDIKINSDKKDKSRMVTL